MKKLICLFLLSGAAVPEARACTTFCLRSGGDLVFGKNYDWDVGEGMVLVNKRNVEKTSLDGGEPAHRWNSSYGSVTFNQFGREQPNGGMNERGLVVELMWLEETRYPEPDARPAIGCLEWIAVQLDSYATVREVIEHAADLRVASRAPLHYLACDALGECATIEFLDGKLDVRSGSELPVAALTNNTYAESLARLKQHVGFGGNAPLPETRGSLERFVRAASSVKGYDRSRPAVQHAFQTLEAVANGSYTKWRIVYDLPAREIHFRTLQNPKVRSLALGPLDFSCATPVRTLDLDAAGSGDAASSLVDYSPQSNRKLIGQVYARTDFLAGVPAAELDAIARHPESMACNEAARPAAASGASSRGD